MSPPAISLRDVWFDYGRNPVLSGVSMDVAAGSFAGLVGPNGGGKSTLLKILLGLLKPKQGTVAIEGQPPHKSGPFVGYVPQFASFKRDFPITARDCVSLGDHHSFFSSRKNLKAAKERADELLNDFELSPFADHQISALSGGQLQRVLIARALMNNPRVLLMDEPTANVDTRSENALFKRLHQLTGDMTILLVSHDIGFISHYVSEVFCLNRSLVCHETSPASEWIDKLYGNEMLQIHHEISHSAGQREA